VRGSGTAFEFEVRPPKYGTWWVENFGIITTVLGKMNEFPLLGWKKSGFPLQRRVRSKDPGRSQQDN
jgi:hypothetical protein